MEAFNLPDSTDWLGTPLAGLVQVEQALRCHVCKDFYDSPMITSCSHTFCSLCIRRSLAADGKCPLCRAADQENRLRGNWSLREAVDTFVQARDAILQVARAPPRAATPAFDAPVADVARSPKRKVGDADVDDIEDDDESGGRKRPRTSTRRSKVKAAEATAVMMRDEAGFEEAQDRDNTTYEPDDGLVSCPICWKRMKPLQVDKHLDTSCPGPGGSQQQATATSSINGGRSASKPLFLASSTGPGPAKALDRLPPLNYSMLNDQALRKKLSGLGISTSGGRQLLEKRHKEWVTLWNANCDSARPKKRLELLQDLATWERTVGAPGPSRASALGAQIKDKDFDGEAWAAKHDTSFKSLIASARKTRSQSAAGARATPPVVGDSGTQISTAAAADLENPSFTHKSHMHTPSGSLSEQIVGDGQYVVDLVAQPTATARPPSAPSLPDGLASSHGTGSEGGKDPPDDASHTPQEHCAEFQSAGRVT